MYSDKCPLKVSTSRHAILLPDSSDSDATRTRWGYNLSSELQRHTFSYRGPLASACKGKGDRTATDGSEQLSEQLERPIDRSDRLSLVDHHPLSDAYRIKRILCLDFDRQEGS